MSNDSLDITEQDKSEVESFGSIDSTDIIGGAKSSGGDEGSGSLYDKYIDFLEYKDTDDYQRYLNLVKMHFSEDKICPECSHQVMPKKSEDADAVQLICKDKCGWYYEFVFPKYVNLYEKAYQYKKERNDIVYKIIALLKSYNGDVKKDSGIKNSFDNLKRQYIESGKKIDDIEKIFKDEGKEIEETEDERFEVFNKLIDMYMERKKVFNRIQHRILRRHKLELMNAYLKKLEKDKLYQLGEKMSITPEDVDSWIKWFGFIEKYSEMLKNLHEITETESEQKDYVYEINMNLMISKPEVRELELDKAEKDEGFLEKFKDAIENEVKGEDEDESENDVSVGAESDSDNEEESGDMSGGFGMPRTDPQDENGVAQGGVAQSGVTSGVVPNVDAPVVGTQPADSLQTANDKLLGLQKKLDEALSGLQNATNKVTQGAAPGAPGASAAPTAPGVQVQPTGVVSGGAVAARAPPQPPIKWGTLDPKHPNDPLNFVPRKRVGILTPLEQGVDGGGVGGGGGGSGGGAESIKINLSRSQYQHLRKDEGNGGRRDIDREMGYGGGSRSDEPTSGEAHDDDFEFF